MKTAVFGACAPKKIVDALRGYADNIILLPPFDSIDKHIRTHADMLIFPLSRAGEKKLLSHAAYYSVAASELDRLAELTHLELELIPEEAAAEYPRDILLNALMLGDTVIGRLDSLSSALADRDGIRQVNTRQGYTKCNACKVTESAIITEDTSVKKAAERIGADVLLIEKGSVALDGYAHGFIGGACGCDSENVFFCGDVTAHPDHERIKSFCERHGKGVIGVGAEPLTDIGSVFFFEP